VSENTGGPPGAPITPRADAEASVGTDDPARLTTAARALVLGNALATRRALEGMQDDVSALGFRGLPRRWGGWPSRIEAVEASDDVLREYNLLDEVRQREALGTAPPVQGTVRGARLPLWNRLVDDRPAVPDCIAWLRLIMTDDEPLTAAAGAVALSGWQRSKDVDVPRPLAAAADLAHALSESADNVARTIAQAALPPSEASVRSAWPRRIEGDKRLGTIVHGTFAWSKSWWEPGGDFHTYVKNDVCTNVYSGGMPFDWSGNYRGQHRKIAAERLAKWAQDAAGGKLCCVFAHSYGGVIALMSTTEGVQIEKLILLSTPVEQVAVEWRNVGRAVSLRIHADLILLAARRRQRFTENVEENYIPRWFVDHGDSHDPSVWADGSWAAALRLNSI
jgi:hypothetical protein